MVSFGPHEPSKLRTGDPAVFSLPDPKAVDGDSLSNLESLSMRAKHLFNNELMADVFFSVDGKRVPAHTFILRIASPVFDTMFSKTWRRNEDIVIKDVKISPFMSLLRWIYCSEIVFEDGNLLDVLRVASKYMVNSLVAVAGPASGDDYIWSLLSHAVLHNDTERTKVYTQKISSSTRHLLRRSDFDNTSVEAMAVLVSQPVLSVSETELFEACFKWAVAKLRKEKNSNGKVYSTEIRKLMEPFIHEFAFAQMSASDFAGNPCLVLREAEQALIFRRIAGKKVETGFRKKRQSHHWDM